MYKGNDKWEAVLEVLKNKMSAPSFETWLKPTTAKITDHTWDIIASNEFSRDWLESRYISDIKHAVDQVTGESADVNIIVDHKHKVNHVDEKVETTLNQIKSLSASERRRLFSDLKQLYEHELQ